MHNVSLMQRAGYFFLLIKSGRTLMVTGRLGKRIVGICRDAASGGEKPYIAGTDAGQNSINYLLVHKSMNKKYTLAFHVTETFYARQNSSGVITSIRVFLQ